MGNLSKILQTKTIKDSIVNFSGTFLTGFLGAVFYILMARFLGPSNFGIFSVSVLVLTLVSDIASIGIDTGIIRFVGKYIKSDSEKALRFLKLGLKVKILISLLVIVIGWITVPFIATHFFNKPEFILPLRLSLVGCFGILLFSFMTSTVNALQRYFLSNGLSVGTNTLRLVFVSILFSLGIFNLNSSIVIYSLAPFVGFLTGMFFVPNFLKIKNENSVGREFFEYNKWVAIFTLIAAISSRLDSFISARFLSLEEIGIYSVAVTLASIVPQVVMALGVVVAPKLASFDSFEKLIIYFRKIQLFVIGLAVAGVIVGIPLAYFAIPIFYGKGYLGSIVPFTILLIAQAIFLISVPVHTTIIYYYSHPKLFVYIGLTNVLIISVLGWVLISSLGLMGAAITVLLGTISNLILPAFWLRNKFGKEIRR